MSDLSGNQELGKWMEYQEEINREIAAELSRLRAELMELRKQLEAATK